MNTHPNHKYAEANNNVHLRLFVCCLSCSLTNLSYSTTVAAVYTDFINQLILLPDENPPVDESTAATFFSGHIKYLPAADGTPTEPNDGLVWLAESAFGQIAATTFSSPLYTITPSANPPAGGSFTPNGVQAVTQGTTKEFTVAANSGYTRSNTVNGTCPQGTWNSNVWTTGAITANCTVIFNFTGGPQLPTCVTTAATAITATSAQLNGSVISNGTTATASFDFGSTNTYGTSVAATPANVYSATPVTVAAVKTGLTCSTTYHYRTKAVSSAGTGLGLNQSFTTGMCQNPTVWLYPTNPITTVGSTFNLDVTVNTAGAKIGAYDFALNFDATKLAVDITQCNQGVCPGNAVPAPTNVITNNTAGTVHAVGISATGIGPSNDLPLLAINFQTKSTTGATAVGLTINELVAATPNREPIGNGVARGATVTVISHKCGDADGNGAVNIVDALAISRKVVGLPPPPTVGEAADVDGSGHISIVDALAIARYSVGLLVLNTCFEQ